MTLRMAALLGQSSKEDQVMDVREPGVAGILSERCGGAAPHRRRFLAKAAEWTEDNEENDFYVERLGAKALVVPHAGYVYSGTCAANAYAIVAKQKIERVVLVGPSHRVSLEGVAAPTARVMRTPLGDVEIDHEALDCAAVPRNDAPHAREHSLEVHLPFIERIAPHARVCPIACGHASAADVARVIGALDGGPETLIVVSTDLSHYLDFETALERDCRTAMKISALDSNLDGDDACGYVGLRGLLVHATEKISRAACSISATRASRAATNRAWSATARSRSSSQAS